MDYHAVHAEILRIANPKAYKGHQWVIDIIIGTSPVTFHLEVPNLLNPVDLAELFPFLDKPTS